MPNKERKGNGKGCRERKEDVSKCTFGLHPHCLINSVHFANNSRAKTRFFSPLMPINQREEEAKRQKDKETKRRRVKETKRRKDKGTRRRRDEESK